MAQVRAFAVGEVVRMRLTPQELSACAAIIKAAGVELPGGTSLSGMARAAVNVLINSAIQCKLIPEPPEWESVSEYAVFKRSYTQAQKAKAGHNFQMTQLQRMQAGRQRRRILRPPTAGP